MPQEGITQVFPAKVAELPNVLAFVESQLEAADCSMRKLMAIDLAIEELFVNIANYGYPDGDGTAEISILVRDGTAVIRLADHGIAFDPLAKPDPDLTLSADARTVGGLGIYLVKKTMDDVQYENENGRNLLTIINRI